MTEEIRNRHGKLMCTCTAPYHKGKPCPNEATMRRDKPISDPPMCTPCLLERSCPQ